MSKTYEVYAMYREGSYLVVTSNSIDHASDMAQRMRKTLSTYPMRFISRPRGEFTLRGNIFTVDQLKGRYK